MRSAVESTRVLVGVSGGADSVALLRGLLDLRDQCQLSICAAHLNHQLRGTDSDQDADWVRKLCEKWQVPLAVEVAQLFPSPPGAGNSGQGPFSGVEETARHARHQFLDQAAFRMECQVIATAHTADDQAETVLHHLFRGTGLAGLRGIPEGRTTAAGLRLVHPMLSVTRQQVEDYLQALGQDYREDTTNRDTTFSRNWLRHNLLPELRAHYGPQVGLSLTRLSEQAAEVEQALQVLANRVLEQSVLDAQPDSVRLNVRGFSDHPRHLVREVFRLVWQQQQWPRQAMGYAEWNRLAEIARVGGNADLPGGIRCRQNPPGLLVLEKTNR